MPRNNIRRKAQLGLDIREGGIAIPIAPNMYYMNGRSHDEGGIGIGPNNKNGLEVEGGEVVKVGNNYIKVFSSVPLLRGVSPAQLVMGGANPNKVFKAQEDFKDRNRINDDGTHYQNGGNKVIKYENLPSSFKGKRVNGKILQGGVPPVLSRGELAMGNPIQRMGMWSDDLGEFSKYMARSIHKFIPKKVDKAYRHIVGYFSDKGPNNAIDNNAENLTKAISLFNAHEYKTGGIYIKPSKRGTFTAAAKKRGMDVQEFASKVLANKEDYSSVMVKKANFARNASRWKKEYGGDDTKTAVLKRLRNKFTIAGNYGGGMFGGAGAGSVIMEQPEYVNDTITKRYLVPVTQTFNDAFRNARNSGQNEFMFDGKLYNTNLGDNPNNNTAGANRISTIIVPIEHKEVRRRKKEYGGNMIYTVNGNVKNGLMSARPKAQYGKIDRKNKDVKVGPDGMIYKRDARGEWWTDGTKHITSIPLIKNSRNDLVDINSGLNPTIIDRNGHYVMVKSIVPKDKKIITRKFDKPKRTYVGGYDEEEKETKKIGSLTYEKNEDGTWVPSARQSITTTRSGSRPKDFGMTRVGVNHPTGKYKYNPMTGEKLTEDGVIETSEPSVKGTTKVSSRTTSTPRRGETKATSSKSAAASKPSTKGADTKYGTPLAEKKESLYMTGIKNNIITPIRAGMEKIKSPSSTRGGTQSSDGRWIGQYKSTNIGDWIGLGSNLAGTIASYFMTKNAINKTPDPIKPVMAQAAKLKTRYNIEPQLTSIREAEQMNRAAVRRNTQSSNVSLAREQRLMNEARGTRNQLYGQKENIETQLINQDRLNRQSVMRDNVKAYNEYLNRLTATRQGQNQLRISNINNLLSGLTGSVNNILGTIESRRATNNTLRAIAAANPNVDARLIGGFDYYIDPITKRKYNKNQQYVGTING